MELETLETGQRRYPLAITKVIDEVCDLPDSPRRQQLLAEIDAFRLTPLGGYRESRPKDSVLTMPETATDITTIRMLTEGRG